MPRNNWRLKRDQLKKQNWKAKECLNQQSSSSKNDNNEIDEIWQVFHFIYSSNDESMHW